MAHLAMLVIFYVDVIYCQNFNLPHIYRIFAKKFIFWDEIYKLITWYPNMVHIMWKTWFNIPSTFIKTKNHLNVFWSIFVVIFIGTLYSFPQIYSNPPLYKMKWNNFFLNLLLMLYSNIICKNIVKIFQKFEVGYTQTCTSLESSTMWDPKGGHRNVLSPLLIINFAWSFIWLFVINFKDNLKKNYFIFNLDNFTNNYFISFPHPPTWI
jgi:hypothetical protein